MRVVEADDRLLVSVVEAPAAVRGGAARPAAALSVVAPVVNTAATHPCATFPSRNRGTRTGNILRFALCICSVVDRCVSFCADFVG